MPVIIPAIPATWEAQVGVWWSEASPGKSARPHLKNKAKIKNKKGWGHGLSSSTYAHA
jgi:hypothetical protein